MISFRWWIQTWVSCSRTCSWGVFPVVYFFRTIALSVSPTLNGLRRWIERKWMTLDVFRPWVVWLRALREVLVRGDVASWVVLQVWLSIGAFMKWITHHSLTRKQWEWHLCLIDLTLDHLLFWHNEWLTDSIWLGHLVSNLASWSDLSLLQDQRWLWIVNLNAFERQIHCRLRPFILVNKICTIAENRLWRYVWMPLWCGRQVGEDKSLLGVGGWCHLSCRHVRLLVVHAHCGL